MVVADPVAGVQVAVGAGAGDVDLTGEGDGDPPDEGDVDPPGDGDVELPGDGDGDPGRGDPGPGVAVADLARAAEVAGDGDPVDLRLQRAHRGDGPLPGGLMLTLAPKSRRVS